MAFAALLSATAPVAPPTALAAVSGDADCDADADTADALSVLRHVAGLSTPACVDAADVDCDAGVDTIDSLSILRHVAGLPVNLPAGCPPIGAEAGLLLLNEVLFLPGPGDSPFVELKNGGGGQVSLDGVALFNERGETHPLTAGSLAAGAVLLVEPGASFLDPESGFVELRRDGEVLDRVAWGDEHADRVNPSKGGVVGDAEPGSTIGRYPGSTETDPLEWVPYGPESATPGEANPAPNVGVLLPLDGAVLDPGPVDLGWYPVAGAAGYRVQVSADETFASPLADETVDDPGFTQDAPGDGEYFWRVQALFAGGVAAAFSPAQSFTIEPDAAAPSAILREVLDVPLTKQRKDTSMLLLESRFSSGPHAWDRAHPDLDKNDPADNMNCVMASLAMINDFLGGDLSQDRIGYNLFSVRYGLVNGPQRDLNYGYGVKPSDMAGLAGFALGGSVEEFSTAGKTTDETWAFVTAAIDVGLPLLAATDQHAVAVRGYAQVGPARFLYLNDPWIGQYRQGIDATGLINYWRPPDDPHPPSDEPGIHQDTDLDGIVDFDETARFYTNPDSADTDGDGVDDKDDVFGSVYAPRGYVKTRYKDPERDWDKDGLPAELDCDTDNDGHQDGEDDDDFSAPPSSSLTACSAAAGEITLSWPEDVDLRVYLLPGPARDRWEAFDYFLEPGYAPWLDFRNPCLTGARSEHWPGIPSVASRYVAVSFVLHCPAGPQTASFHLSVRPPDGTVAEYDGVLNQGEVRVFGPFDFHAP